MCHTDYLQSETERESEREGETERERERRERDKERGSEEREEKCLRKKENVKQHLSFKPRLIRCLLIWITIAACCKIFDGFVQILVPLIHNYRYTCRTKGNFRRGEPQKAAARARV